MFTITSPAFAEGELIPREYSCEGNDSSPELRWSHAPEGTQSFALICDDPDAPVGVWTHWVAYDIPAATTSLAKGNVHPPKGMKEGVQSGKKMGYRGPCPPPGHGPHRYYFTIYALDCASLELRVGADRGALEKAMSGHVIGKATYMGRYERK